MTQNQDDNLRSKEIENFWIWFQKIQNELFFFEKNQTELFNTLKMELNKIHPYLVFEFSPILEDKTREFVISADGVVTIFPIVENLVNRAPNLEKWKMVAFRQAKSSTTQINYGNLSVKLEDVYFSYSPDNRKIELKLSIKNYQESVEWNNAIFILLDNVIGEYHTEMSLSKIEKTRLEESEKNELLPISTLPSIIKTIYN